MKEENRKIECYSCFVLNNNIIHLGGGGGHIIHLEPQFKDFNSCPLFFSRTSIIVVKKNMIKLAKTACCFIVAGKH